MFMSSTATARRRSAARPSAAALLDVAVAAAALAGSLALLRHGGIGPSRPGSGELDLVGVVLAACSTVPLLAWRRFPLGVFAVTAAAGVLLAGTALGLVAMSRIYLNVHWLSDVIGGFTLGTAYLLIAIWASQTMVARSTTLPAAATSEPIEALPPA